MFHTTPHIQINFHCYKTTFSHLTNVLQFYAQFCSFTDHCNFAHMFLVLTNCVVQNETIYGSISINSLQSIT